jgi:hypothetical protein
VSTIYDRPCPPPTDEEENLFAEYVLPHFLAAMYRRFGRDRAEVILDHWHVSTIAAYLAGWERGHSRRILSDLNEEFRHQQFVEHVEWENTEEGFRPWLLVPTREP